MKKIILDLCGGTGAWSKPYKVTGYAVFNITLPKWDVRKFYYDGPQVYGILASPPCTMFSRARSHAKTPRDIDGALEIVRACMRIIWQYKPHFWALENPMGMLRRYMGRPCYTFDPCDFGDPWLKKTDLWGWFNEPVKHPVKPKNTNYGGSRWGKLLPELPDDYILPDGMRKETAQRSMTPGGFANAFFKANL